MFGVYLYTCLFVHIFLRIWVWLVVCFLWADQVCPCLKKWYHGRLERARGYLETVSDFDELLSPQYLFIHFLGLELSSQVWKNIEDVKKSKYVCSVGLEKEWWLGLIIFFFLPRMTIRFSKGKLVEVQEKKAKTGLKGGLLTRKRQRESEPNKEDHMVTSPVTTSMPHRPTSPTFSLELITHSHSFWQRL